MSGIVITDKPSFCRVCGSDNILWDSSQSHWFCDDCGSALSSQTAESGVEADLKAALERQADNMAFVLNHVSVPDQYYEKFTRELAEDRAALSQERK